MNEREENRSARRNNDPQKMLRPIMVGKKKNWDLRSSDINPIIIEGLICAVLRWAAQSAGRGGVNNVPWPGWGK